MESTNISHCPTSLYLRDQEGNQVELFTDNPAIDWRSSSEWLQAPSLPFQL